MPEIDVKSSFVEKTSSKSCPSHPNTTFKFPIFRVNLVVDKFSVQSESHLRVFKCFSVLTKTHLRKHDRGTLVGGFISSQPLLGKSWFESSSTPGGTIFSGAGLFFGSQVST